MILLITRPGVKNDPYLIDWRVHVIQASSTTSRPAEPKFMVIRAQKKLRTINAGGWVRSLSGFLSVHIATKTLFELLLLVVN